MASGSLCAEAPGNLCPRWQKKWRQAITGIVENFLRRASQRHLTNLALEYLAVAGGVGAFGAILLLILGRQILDWYWPVLLFVAALSFGLYQARKRRLTVYRLAQVIDARLNLSDRLSTLVYFQTAKASPELFAIIERQATERLRAQDLPVAMPIVFPRYGYACIALVMAAGGFLGLRYGLLRTMDLNPPLANIHFAPLQPEPKAYAANKKSAIQERFEQQLKELGLTPDDLEVPDEKGIRPEQAEVPAAANDPGAAPAEKQDGQRSANAPSPEGNEDSDSNGEKTAGENAENSSGNEAGEKGKASAKQQNAEQNAKNGQAGSQDSMMSKMRDAVANLVNKLKNQGQQGGEQQTASNQPQGQMSRQQQSQQGTQSQGKQQGEGQPGADQQGDQNGDKNAADKTRAGDKSGDRPGNQEAKSGMGQQDGDKAIREAHQLAAMGKISEIFGKRAQQLTGEMTIEVSSGKQQLRTQWSERKALHADTGAETNRNEIPLAYQSYVQRYFEEVRKASGTKAKAQATP